MCSARNGSQRIEHGAPLHEWLGYASAPAVWKPRTGTETLFNSLDVKRQPTNDPAKARDILYPLWAGMERTRIAQRS